MESSPRAYFQRYFWN